MTDERGRYPDTHLGNPSFASFKDLFVDCIHDANDLVFDNGQECKVFNQEALSLLPKVGVDLVYADPPYITQFGANDYEDKIHFVEGLMTCWEGKEIRDNARRNFPSRTKYSRDDMQQLIAGFIDGTARIGARLIMSYRDKAYPTAAELKELMGEKYGTVDFRRRAVSYGIARYAPEGPGRDAQEYLLIATKPKALKAAAADKSDLAPIAADRFCHTTVTAEIKLGRLQSNADGDLPQENKRFTFILVHAGVNRNGDFFTIEELRSNYRSAVGTKVDLKHSQDLTDIVGGVVDARFFENDDGYVECDGELYASVNPNAQLAYKLMTKGIVRQVSMECDYEEGECSICARRFKSKSEYCVHLKNNKGREFQGKPVYEILHNITFTGMGLLDRKGADERAVITKVASQENKSSEAAMSEEDIKKLQTENERLKGEVDDLKKQVETKTKAEEAVADEKRRAEAAVKSKKDEEIDRLTKENEALQKQVDDLTGKAKAYEAEKLQTARRARASDLVILWEKRGRSFAGDEDRKKEIERLASLDDASFIAAKSMVDGMPEIAAKKETSDPNKPDDPAKKEPKKVLRSDAGIDPSMVDDKPGGLVDRLGKGLREVRDALE